MDAQECANPHNDASDDVGGLDEGDARGAKTLDESDEGDDRDAGGRDGGGVGGDAGEANHVGCANKDHHQSDHAGTNPTATSPAALAVNTEPNGDVRGPVSVCKDIITACKKSRSIIYVSFKHNVTARCMLMFLTVRYLLLLYASIIVCVLLH